MLIKKVLKKIYSQNKIVRVLINKLLYVFNNNKKEITGLNNQLDVSDSRMKKTKIVIAGNNNKIVIQNNSKIDNIKINVFGNNHKLIIGRNCNIKGGTLWIEDQNCSLLIGDETTIEEAHIAVTEPNSTIKIGNDCMFSSGIDIRNGDSHSILDLKSNNRINRAKNINIGDHVWLGAHVQILKGVSIGDNSVIGIKSVVTKNIPENCIAVGLPAKKVRDGVYWTRERIYS